MFDTLDRLWMWWLKIVCDVGCSLNRMWFCGEVGARDRSNDRLWKGFSGGELVEGLIGGGQGQLDY